MSKKVAGVYFYGGKASQFIACVFEYFGPGNRWVLDNLYFSSNTEKCFSGSFDTWAKENKITDLVVNFPVDQTYCHSCQLECPGESDCPQKGVLQIKGVIDDILNKDQSFEKSNPKEYERKRNKEEEVIPRYVPFEKGKENKLLTKGLRKRLRKGYTPYWNRPIDVFVWLNYYDELSQIFNYSYDSYGHTSLMTVKRFDYLKKHLRDISVWESNIQIGLLELLRYEILGHEDLYGLKFVDEFSVSLRKNIVSKIEQNLNIFIPNEDSAVLTFDPKAINALILSLAGLAKVQNQILQLPNWCKNAHPSFIVPTYSEN